MFDTQHAKRPERERSQAAPVQKTSRTKHHTPYTGDPTRLPRYTQAWGNQPPPWLRLSVQRQDPHEHEPPTQRAENTTGLPDTLKAGIEHLSGMSMDDVQVHYNSSKPAQVQALAYTQGAEIHVGAGQEKHLPHEAWHVVQQMQGRVSPTMQTQRGTINDDPRLEREATLMGEKATHGESVQHLVRPPIVHNAAAEPTMLAQAPIQCNGGGSQSEGEGRQKAVEIAQTSPVGSVGHGISLILGPTTSLLREVGNLVGAGDWFAELGAAKIGKEVYEANRTLLHQPGTRENVHAFVTLETEYLAKQSGSPQILGGMLTAERRTDLVVGVLDMEKKQKENVETFRHPQGESGLPFGSRLAGLD